MNQETLKCLHESYQRALESSSDIMEIIENLYDILENAEVPEEDTIAFDSFLDGLRGCIFSRKKTFKVSNLTTYLVITIMYIILWLNESQNLQIDTDIFARRKALESELTKILRKSNSNISVNIRDRFGIRCVLRNTDSDERIQEYIYWMFDGISGIIAGKNRKMLREFKNWVKENSNIDSIDKSIIEYVLKIPFSIDFVKDFIKYPKDNNYQTLQFTMHIQMYSETLPGLQLEVQLRSEKMDREAENGTASHEEYKKYEDEDKAILEVFKVDDFSKISIKSFTGISSEGDDKDGIHFAKKLYSRTLSTTLVDN